MKKPDIKLILCDLGNVLINFDHRLAVRKILPYTDKTFDEVYQLFFDSPITKDYEEGRLTSYQFYSRMSSKLGVKGLSFNQFSSIWNEIFFENEGMLEVLRYFKKKYRLHLISNINELHFRYLRKKFPEHFKIFDKFYLSYEVGRRKPHRRIYRRAMEDLGLKPEEVIYTDDRTDLIREAKKLKIRTVLFKNVGDFKKRLKKLGIYP